MGIDLNKLNELVKVADQAGNKNGQLDVKDKKEVSVFEAEIEKLNLSEAEKNNVYSIMGLETTKVATAPANLSKKDKKALKNANERREEYTLRQLSNIVAKGYKPEQTMTELENRIGVIDNPKYQELKNEVKYVLDLTPAYNSKDDVESIKKTVKKALKAAGKWDDFHKDVLEQVEIQAEKAQRAKEYDEIKATFEAKYDKTRNNLEYVMEVVKETYKNKGSYYKDEIKDFEKNYVMLEARKIARNAIYNSDETSGRKVGNEAKEEIKANGAFDKYTKKALKGENNFWQKLAANDSDVKIAKQNQARHNKVENAKTQSKEQILDALGNKNELFEALLASELVKENADGTYDLSDLSYIIGLNVGANNKLDRHAKIDKAISEKLRTTGALSVATMLEDLSESEATKLVKLCGYEKEGKNFGKAVLHGLFGALGGAAAAGAAEATRGKTTIHNTYEANNHLELKLNGEGLDASEILGMTHAEMLEAGITVENLASGIKVVIDQTRLKDFFYQTGTHFMNAATKGAIVGGVIGFLEGLKDTGEIPITPTQFECTSLDDYKARVEKETPKYAKALTALAMTFQNEDGTWDCEGFKAFLNRTAGDGGKLNKEEFIRALKRIDIPADKKVEEKPEEEQEPEVEQAPCEGEKCNAEINEKVDSLTHKRQPGDSWMGIANAYYPCLVEKYGLWGKDGAIRKIKEALSRNEDGTLNQDTYRRLLNGGNLPETMILPAEIDGCERENGTVKKQKATGNGRSLIRNVGHESKSYNAVDGCDETQTATGKTRQEALNNLKQQTGKTYENEEELLK